MTVLPRAPAAAAFDTAWKKISDANGSTTCVASGSLLTPSVETAVFADVQLWRRSNYGPAPTAASSETHWSFRAIRRSGARPIELKPSLAAPSVLARVDRKM